MKIADNLEFDLDIFRGQRAIFQGASGSGKSNGARLLLEATYGQFQHLILDVEDEFHTLRTDERDYAIIGGDHGDIPLGNIDMADELALTLLGLGVSTVVQIGDRTLSEKRRFIWQFVSGMMRAKADLWHPVVVMLDESHLFVPQQGVEICSEAITHLATAGRKRGFSTIFATQRLSLISKDVLGQCENKFLGRVEQAADRRAVADLLGFGPRSEEAVDMQAFRPGEFYAVGPAISLMPIRARLNRADTQAPKPGTTVLPTPTPAAIQRALGGLAASMARPEADPQSTASQGSPSPVNRGADLGAAEERGYRRGLADGEARAKTADAAFRSELMEIARDATALAGRAAALVTLPGPGRAIEATSGPAAEPAAPSGQPLPKASADAASLPTSEKPTTGDLTPPLQRALDSVAWWKAMGFHEVERRRAAITAGLSPIASTFGVYVGKLIEAGLLEVGEPGCIRLTADGIARATAPETVSADEVIEKAVALLDPQPARVMRILQYAYPNPVPRNEIADRLGLSRTASTTGVYISKCSRLGFVEPAGNGMVKAAAFLFPG